MSGVKAELSANYSYGRCSLVEAGQTGISAWASGPFYFAEEELVVATYQGSISCSVVDGECIVNTAQIKPILLLPDGHKPSVIMLTKNADGTYSGTEVYSVIPEDLDTYCFVTGENECMAGLASYSDFLVLSIGKPMQTLLILKEKTPEVIPDPIGPKCWITNKGTCELMFEPHAIFEDNFELNMTALRQSGNSYSPETIWATYSVKPRCEMIKGSGCSNDFEAKLNGTATCKVVDNGERCTVDMSKVKAYVTGWLHCPEGESYTMTNQPSAKVVGNATCRLVE